MLFPDPWPKKRHRERRLFSPSLLDKMARILRPAAEFRFASDIADYAEAAIEHATAHPDFDLALTFTSANRARAAGLARHPLRDEGLQSGAVFNIYRAETQASFLNAPT